MTVLIKNQKIKKIRTIGDERLEVVIRHDDECGNGHNTFSITGTLYERGRDVAGGCLHEEVRQFFPELAPYIKWHLCSTNGPVHYIANTVYHAGDKDCHGLRKGESRQIRNGKTGQLAWQLTAHDAEGNEVPLYALKKYLDADECPPCPYTLNYTPWCRIGEGKEPDLEVARSSAIWPDATLEQLQDKAQLEARLPELMKEFQAAVESLGLVY